MDNQIIRITAEEATPQATAYFNKLCGFDREGEKIRRMRTEGLEIQAYIRGNIRISAVASFFRPPTRMDAASKRPPSAGSCAGALRWDKDKPDAMTLCTATNQDEFTFTCNAFEQIDKDSVLGVYGYLLTAGVYMLDDSEPIMRQLYADIWGTAFVDAGLDILKTRLSDGAPFVCVGPGFYGMDHEQINHFFTLLDGAKIGMELLHHRLMKPLKSCAGFLILANDPAKLPPADCANCLGNHKGCLFCHAAIKAEK